MAVATALGKQTYFPEIIIQHFNPHANKSVPFDILYVQNYQFWSVDEAIYNRRKEHGFYVNLPQKAPAPASKPKLQFL
jgi:hypothetical protein